MDDEDTPVARERLHVEARAHAHRLRERGQSSDDERRDEREEADR